MVLFENNYLTVLYSEINKLHIHLMLNDGSFYGRYDR